MVKTYSALQLPQVMNVASWMDMTIWGLTFKSIDNNILLPVKHQECHVKNKKKKKRERLMLYKIKMLNIENGILYAFIALSFMHSLLSSSDKPQVHLKTAHAGSKTVCTWTHSSNQGPLNGFLLRDEGQLFIHFDGKGRLLHCRWKAGWVALHLLQLASETTNGECKCQRCFYFYWKTLKTLMNNTRKW